ncbi:MAG: NUDIX hydrolase [Mycobacteriales bacterium]
MSRPGGDIEIAVVHRPRYDDWSLPKGKLDDGEHPLLAAVREVREETGFSVRTGRRLTTSSYLVDGEPKQVDHWAMSVVGGEFVPGDEVDELRWLAPPAAQALLSSPQDADVVDALLSAPCDTTPLLLVRHGRAGDSQAWTGNDALRPLDPVGLEQAGALAELLPPYRPTRVLSADRVRCIDTVRPLADRLAIPLDVDRDFSEDSHAEDPGRMAARLRALATTGEPVVVCSQGGVIPDTVSLLAQQDAVTLTSRSARKGSVWALHFARTGRLVSADYYPHPGQPESPAAMPAASPAEAARS